MNEIVSHEERQELVEIYNSISPPLKKQLLTIARVIDTTREITLGEVKRANVEIAKQ